MTSDLMIHSCKIQEPLTDASKHCLQKKVTERLLTALPVINTTINQKWPLIMIMEEVMMVMEKGAGKTKQNKIILHAASATVSQRRLAGHACCVATPPSMLCKPHSFKIKVQWTAHNINNENKQQHKHRQEVSSKETESVCAAPLHHAIVKPEGLELDTHSYPGNLLWGRNDQNKFSLLDMGGGKTEEKMGTIKK